MRIEQIELSDWERALPNDGFEVFHTREALEALDRHVDGELRLYGGFNGQQAVALLPLFVQKRAVGTAITSPPPSMGIPRMGPVLMPNSPKRRKQEKLNQEFADEVLEHVDVDDSLTVFRMICNAAYADPRPYVWHDMNVETNFTYELDVGASSPDELMKSFSKSLRREMRDAMDLDVEVSVEGTRGAKEIYLNTKNRYAEQGESFTMTWDYVKDLSESLGERSRAYVVRDPDGNFLSGINVLYSNDAAYFWQGGARATYEGVSVNSLLHWRIIEDIAAGEPIESVSKYDLMGANTKRLCRYKAKFGAELVPYYVVESGGAQMNIAKKAYQLVSQ